jgi:hypothetical protein
MRLVRQIFIFDLDHCLSLKFVNKSLSLCLIFVSHCMDRKLWLRVSIFVESRLILRVSFTVANFHIMTLLVTFIRKAIVFLLCNFCFNVMKSMLAKQTMWMASLKNCVFFIYSAYFLCFELKILASNYVHLLKRVYTQLSLFSILRLPFNCNPESSIEFLFTWYSWG